MKKTVWTIAFVALVLFCLVGVSRRAELEAIGADRLRPGDDVEVATESLRISAADGVRSMADLIRAQTVGSPIPNQSISSIHILVDADGGDLILDRSEGFQPPGFQLAINAGQDKKFRTTKVDLKGIAALEFFPVKTESRTPCNFLLILEFYPRR